MTIGPQSFVGTLLGFIKVSGCSDFKGYVEMQMQCFQRANRS